MLPWTKIAGLSAILAAGAVTAFGSTGRAAITAGKISYDRLPLSSAMPEVWSEARALAGAPAPPPPYPPPRRSSGRNPARGAPPLPHPVLISPLDRGTAGALGAGLIVRV